MDILILGGTLFLGRYVAEAALGRAHRVSLFHRGRTNPGLFAGAEHLIGDRDGGLGVLAGRRWDAVIDTSGYVPRVVRAAVERLAGAVGHYTFVSSISVYADTASGADEASAVATIAEPTEEITGGSYGALKALCERVVDEAFPGRVFIVRPGLIVGPDDPTDRFTYWPRRMARGGEVLAPGRPAAPLQLVDVRDLAQWMVAMAERGAAGVYNATGPAGPLTLGETLETCRAVAETGVRLTWVDEAFLLERSVQPWSELPLWVPESDAGFLRVDVSKALAAGLSFRPLADTAHDTLVWDRATPAAGRPKKSGLATSAGMAPEREAELLGEWHRRAATRG